MSFSEAQRAVQSDQLQQLLSFVGGYF